MQILDTLFGRAKTPAERLREHQRSLQRAQRELDRERTKLEQQEKKLVMDIKKAAKAGQMGPCKVMAKDLVRTRRYISKFYSMRTQLQAVSLRLQTLRSNEQMAQAMKGATRAMALMSKTMNLPQISKILQDFERESSSMDMKEEMMSDTIDDVMEDEGETEEEESDKILKQVLDEIGVSVSQQLGETPEGLGAPQVETERRQAVAVGESGPSYGGASLSAGGGGGRDPEVDDLQARLDRLRKD
ncbi:Snf7-domain-containing protein [Cystobasidium minutum MCA 4210]|uniref:Snf7-domain-containing protein n=1 Tax=Cystobasidium minutum MCA 4210 TaxID=1397322 RepID=UPI0034CDA8C7|eukprot:jgi/Rhomi1/212704/estExt_Genemark1.C_70218